MSTCDDCQRAPCICMVAGDDSPAPAVLAPVDVDKVLPPLPSCAGTLPAQAFPGLPDYVPVYTAPQMEAYARAAVEQMAADLVAAREEHGRAAYWKQRAKTAEGHLLASDLTEAAKALHKVSALKETPWDELTDMQRWGFEHATLQVVATVNGCRDSRKPHDNEEHAA